MRTGKWIALALGVALILVCVVLIFLNDGRKSTPPSVVQATPTPLPPGPEHFEMEWVFDVDASEQKVLPLAVCASSLDKAFVVAGQYFEGALFASSDLRTPTLEATSQTSNAFFAKYDSSRKLQWLRRFDPEASVATQFLSVASGGNIYAAGPFTTPLRVNPDMDVPIVLEPLAETRNYYLTAFTSEGFVSWACSLSMGRFPPRVRGLIHSKKFIRGINAMPDGGVLVLGMTYQTLKISSQDGLVYEDVNQDAFPRAFFARFDDTGKIIWVRTAGGQNPSEISDFCVLDDGTFYAVGSFNTQILLNRGMVDEMEILATPGEMPYMTDITNPLLVRFDSKGVALWAEAFGLDGGSTGVFGQIAMQRDGDLVVSGALHGSGRIGGTSEKINFGQDGRPEGLAFIVGLNSSGEWLWGRSISAGDSGAEIANDTLLVSPKGDIYFAVRSGDNLTFMADATRKKDEVFRMKLPNQYLLVRYSPEGELKETFRIGDNAGLRVGQITASSDGGFFVRAQSTLDATIAAGTEKEYRHAGKQGSLLIHHRFTYGDQ